MTEKRFTINDCRVLSDEQVLKILNQLTEENEQLKQLIKKTLETTPIEHTLAIELKNSVRELYLLIILCYVN